MRVLLSSGIERAVDGLDATGWTPLAAAITRAGSLFEPSEAAGGQVVWVISDGEETCGGDQVAAARALHEGGTRAVVNIVGCDLPAKDRAALEAVADAGGGGFTEVAAGEDFARVLARVSEASAETQAAPNDNKATAVTARNDAMACYVGQKNAEQAAFTAYRSANRTTKERPTPEVMAMRTALRDRMAAGEALIEAYEADLDARGSRTTRRGCGARSPTTRGPRGSTRAARAFCVNTGSRKMLYHLVSAHFLGAKPVRLCLKML